RLEAQPLEDAVEFIDDAGVVAIDVDLGLPRRDVEPEIGGPVVHPVAIRVRRIAVRSPLVPRVVPPVRIGMTANAHNNDGAPSALRFGLCRNGGHEQQGGGYRNENERSGSMCKSHDTVLLAGNRASARQVPAYGIARRPAIVAAVSSRGDRPSWSQCHHTATPDAREGDTGRARG